MPAHMLQVATATTNATGAAADLGARKTQAQNFVDNHSEVLSEQASSFAVRNTAEDGSGVDYGSASWRFDFAEALPALKTVLEAWLTGNFEWAAYRYHECDHTDDAREGCSWDHAWETGTVPPDVRAAMQLDSI